ncbi:MAG: hypothetical protein ACOYK6_08320 [Chthoniobacterales bacterium]
MNASSIHSGSNIENSSPLSGPINEASSQHVIPLGGSAVSQRAHHPIIIYNDVQTEATCSPLKPFTQVATFAYTLFHSIPPFLIEGDRARYTQERDAFRLQQTECERLGLTHEFNELIQAYEDVIQLPSWGYHFTAGSLYNNLNNATDRMNNAYHARRREEQVRQATTNPMAPGTYHISRVDGNVTNPTAPGAYHISRVYRNSSADDIAQADDAVRGPDRALEIPTATIVDDDSSVEENPPALEAEQMTQASLGEMSQSTTDIEEVNPALIGIPVAEAQRVDH